MAFTFKKPSVLPGFGLTFGFTVFYLSLIVLIPLGAMFVKTAAMTWAEFWAAVASPRVVASYKLTFGTSLIAAAVNVVFGGIAAWCLVRYTFPGRRFIDAMVDLPFALPTSVSGIALVTIFSKKGWIGEWLPPGIKAAYSPLGITIALTFIGLPFVIRTLQPALEELEKDAEEAAVSLGAGRWPTFRRIIFPALIPAILTGFALSFARAVGEYGSVVFISGNIPMKTEITPLLIMTKLEEYNYAGATALAVVMLLFSFVILFAINLLQWWSLNRYRSAS